MGNLATALAKGRGVTRDIDSAVAWYRKAADAGHAPAAARLAETLLSGEVPRDLAAAVRWAQLAAQQGDRHGCALMAQLHFWGWGVARDSRLMAGYLDCGAGLAEADVIRAEAVVRSGDGAQGRAALEDAAARGLAEARLTLARLALEPDLAASLRGEAPAQDLEAARKWLGDGVAVTGDEADAYRAVLSLAGGAKEESISRLERIAARSPLAGVLAALAILSLPAPDRALAERLLRTGSDAQIGYADEVLTALKNGAARVPASSESETLFTESEQAFATGRDGRVTLEAASRSGFRPARCRLGWRLALGAGVDPDRARGLTLMGQDCDPLLMAEALLLGTPDEKAGAEAMLRDRAVSGDIRAAVLLGRAYVEGRLAPADPNAATVLLEGAHAKDDADGRAWLGRAMLELNREAGIAHLRAAEKAGSCDAAVLRSRALDTADDPESPGGQDRLAACAKAGHAASAYLVGRAFWLSGDPPTRDIGRRLMRIASNAGHAEATYNLAVAFREGAAGEPRDPEFAARLFERALAGGYGDAAYSLGRLHAR